MLTVSFFASCQNSNPATQSNDNQSASYEDIDATAFAEKMNDAGVVPLDVRTPGEIARGKIAGAVEMDFHAPDFQQQFARLDKDKTYLVYCASGVRSRSNCQMMQTNALSRKISGTTPCRATNTNIALSGTVTLSAAT